jgi:tRNA (Thr-GGU) A37 N-methylase
MEAQEYEEGLSDLDGFSRIILIHTNQKAIEM